MMRFSAWLAAMFAMATPAAAQQFSPNPDMGTYQARAATYAAGTADNVLGDGSNAKGGIAPAFTTHPEPTENFTVPNGWLRPGAEQPVVSPTGPRYEKKIRSVANASHFGLFDPIRFYGQVDAGHCHEFFGLHAANPWTTRLLTQVRPATSAAGGPANATAYWEPCWLTTINSKAYAMPAALNVFYYVKGVNANSVMTDDLQRLHLLLGFIMGVNVDDPDDTKVKAEIAAANAQPGTSPTRYEYIGNGFTGYVCLLANGNQAAIKGGLTRSPGFTLLDGTDPWEGRCVAGSMIYAEVNAPGCWDGVNVLSPNGYDHFRYGIKDNVKNKRVCPNGWYEVPELAVKTDHQTQGWDDYKLWRLSSDAMVAATLGRAIPPGASFHADWKNGWNKAVLDKWLLYCMGIGTNQPHECDGSAMDATTTLLTTEPTPDGRAQQVYLDRQVNSLDPTQLQLINTTRGTHVNMRGM